MGVYDERVSPFISLPSPATSRRAHKKGKSVEPNLEKGESLNDNTNVGRKIFEETVKYGLSKKKNKEEVVRTSQQVVYCLKRMSEIREKVLGKNSKLRNGGMTYNRVVYNTLTGDNTFDETLTPEQFCDLYEYTIQHEFWKKFIKSPAGVNRNLLKLWNTEEFNSWSLRSGKPENHRAPVTEPSENEIKKTPKRGTLMADMTYQDFDPTYISPEW